ncbi:MAG: acyl-CoA dehydrogenase, partial [Marinobacter sp.]
DQRLGAEGGAGAQLQQALSLAKITLAAEQLGVASEALDLAVAYTLEREQFGRAIASYQAVKHKAADMKLKVEVARSSVYYAACVASEVLAEDGDERIAAELDEAAAMAKGYCSDTVFFNAGNALQLFGGVGFTAEYDIQLYFKRAKASELYLGNGAVQREQIAAMLLDGESA